MNVRVLALLLLAGCSAPQSQIFVAYRKNIEAKYASGNVPDDASYDSPEERAQRNQVIDELLVVCDGHFRDRIDAFYGQTGFAETIADMLQIGTASASAFAIGEVTKTVLAAASSFVGATRTSIAANIFQNQGRIPIIVTMYQLHLLKLAEIETGMRRSVTRYPLSAAMVDLAEYDAIDEIAALRTLTKESVKNLQDAQDTLDNERKATPKD